MKQYKIPSYLKDEDDYDKLYDDKVPVPEEKPKEEALPNGYMDQKEREFYGDDVDFMRFHKRTTENVRRALQELIDSSKQVAHKVLGKQMQITLQYVQLNKACSVVHAWWKPLLIDDLSILSDEVLEQEAVLKRKEIQAYRERAAKEQVEQAKKDEEDVDETQVKRLYESMLDLEILKILTKDKQRMVEAEIQKRLTKAAPFYAGKVCQNLGLRYAPEIRFYRDNTFEQYQDFKQQAVKHLQDQERERHFSHGVRPELIEFKEKLEAVSKLPVDKRMEVLNQIKEPFQKA